MMMLIHRICIAFSGLGRPRTVDTAISDRAAMLLLAAGVHTCVHKKEQEERHLLGVQL